MRGELQTAKQVLKDLDRMLLAIRATGGYYVRKDIPLSKHKIDRLCEESEPKIREMAVRLVVAETMLQEPPPSLHPRWKEYVRRRKECLEQLPKSK